MLYDITLKITYTYETPAASNRVMLRMLPLTLPEQKLISGFVGTDPQPDFRRDRIDFFGNPMTELAHDQALSEVTFRFDGRVRRTPLDVSLDLSCAHAALPETLAAIRSIAPESPHHFLGTSERIRHEPEIVDYARSQCEPGMSTLAVVRALASALHRDMTFDPDSTEVGTTAIEAFRNRRGVCQDFTHIMITALRALGIPAGYVSGFLRTSPPPGQERLEGADAMHAWVRAWCGGETGWVQIDPTNDMMVGADHIVVALGRDYADVAPVKGSHRAMGGHATTHQVDVAPVV